jgi:hypothetical protein
MVHYPRSDTLPDWCMYDFKMQTGKRLTRERSPICSTDDPMFLEKFYRHNGVIFRSTASPYAHLCCAHAAAAFAWLAWGCLSHPESCTTFCYNRSVILARSALLQPHNKRLSFFMEGPSYYIRVLNLVHRSHHASLSLQRCNKNTKQPFRTQHATR